MTNEELEVFDKALEVYILHLPLKVMWFNMQESGEKTEEYREITPYWYIRLYQRKKEFVSYFGRLNMVDAEYACQPKLRHILKEGFKDHELKPFTHVLLRYGYTVRYIVRRIDSITIGRGKVEWGAPPDRDVFIIKHHKEDDNVCQ